MWTEKTQSMEKVPPTKTISISEKDIDYIFKTCCTFSRWIFLWPINPQHSAINEIIQVFAKIVCISLIIFELVNNFLHVIFVLKTFKQRLIIAPYTIFVVMSFLRYILLWGGGKRIKKCIEYVKEDCQYVKTEEQRELIIKNTQFEHFMSVGMAIGVYGGGVWYYIVRPLMSESIITEKNNTIKPFPAPIYGAYATNSPFYEILIFLQLYIQFVLISTNCIAFSLTSTFSIHACGQFEMVIFEFSKLAAGSEKNQMNDKLILIFKHHLRILKFISHLKNCVSGLCLSEVLGCTLLICVLSYTIINAWKEHDTNLVIPFVMFIISVVFNIFIFSYVGELLSTKAIEFGQCAYMINWYDIPKSMSLNLIHLIRISHFPSQLTAGKFFVLSMYTFGSVMKSSAMYCNFIWSMEK